MMMCALAPPTPNEFTPARRGAVAEMPSMTTAGRSHGANVRCTTNGVSENGM
jgi:hypothetical protein